MKPGILYGVGVGPGDPELLDALKQGGYTAQGIQNCGTEEEQLFYSTEEIPADAGYYTVIIVKEKNT